MDKNHLDEMVSGRKRFNKLLQVLLVRKKYWIAFTGDSITSCEWVHPNWRDIVIYVLHQEVTDALGDWKMAEWGIKGFNFGYDGATTKDVWERLEDILLVKPQMVISVMGGNDPVLGVSVEDSLEYISKVADVVSKSGAELLWSNSTPAGKGSKKNFEYMPYADAFMKLPPTATMHKIDMFNLYKEFPTEKFFTFISEENPIEGVAAGEIDLQHPNQLGNSYIAKVILNVGFGIEFDPEKYITSTLAGEKYPRY